MQTYALEYIDAAPAWRVYVKGRRTYAYIPIIGNPAPVGLTDEQKILHWQVNNDDDNQPF